MPARASKKHKGTRRKALNVRMSALEYRRIEAAARMCRASLSAWVRHCLREAAEQALREHYEDHG